MEQQIKLPKICFCGRPNVGKSSLFNRLLGKKKALVLDEPGVTRDVYRAEANWDGVRVELADLAGLEVDDRGKSDKAKLARLAKEVAINYLKSADLVVFVVDGRAGLLPEDEELARTVRKLHSNVLVVLSKAEGKVEDESSGEVSTLGWGVAVATSAEHNRGIEGLKEEIVARLGLKAEVALETETQSEENLETEEVEAKNEKKDTALKPVRFGVYGRPNVGKSTLVNTLLGESRMITSPIAGTTVDAIDTDFERDGRKYQIIDTAGIRRKSRTEQGVEVLSVVQALKSIERVDISLFLIDGYEGVTDQDEKVAGELVKSGKPIVIIVNKWDLCRITKEKYAEKLRNELAFLDYAPVLFVTAKEGEGLESIFELADEIVAQRKNVATTGELNRFFEMLETINNPQNLRIYFASQTGRNPPTITCMVNDPKKAHFAYVRFLKNELRTRYGWVASPIRMFFKARKRSESKRARENY